ncbi:hypothetical protein RVR_9063 [Actinacidiphila reveromycinica]|uniref:DUF6895 domain-containing protein n=1 Tax=Actinacidiphila reveromycinica TaxID=659352 RepID=A0A7U3UZ89_9ACTN|nr:hypothetical protein RVR_9063 [Streptomyces sp. SN-593]
MLDRIVAGALTRIDAMRPSFRLPADVATDADPNLTLKPLGELAELTDVVRACHPLPAVRALADDLFAFAWRETRDGALFAELVRGEPQATYPVELYGVFARAGLRHPGAEELLAATTRLRLWRLAREDHTRTLNVLNAERRVGLPQHADFAAVLARTGLGARPEPWALDLRTAYGVTHDVFHVTDWGRTPWRMPAALAGYLRLWLPAWTTSWSEERQWDLTGELLAVAACTPGVPYDPFAWRVLAAAQHPDGAVPETGDGPPEGAAPEAWFTGCYHSTLVAAFAATLARTAPAACAGPRAPDARGAATTAGPYPYPCPSPSADAPPPAPAESEVLP